MRTRIGFDDIARRVARRIGRARDGSVAIHVGLMLTVVIGMVALGTEITLVLFKQRQMQSVADAAALGGATALAAGYPADLTLEARAIAGSLGFISGIEGTSVVVNNPPLSGPYTGDARAVEAIISQPQTLSMVGLFRAPLFNVGARAVATAAGSTQTFCVLQTIANFTTGVTLSSGSTTNLENCGLAANSTGTSLRVTSSTLNTQSVSVSGTVQTTGGGVINSVEPVQTQQPAVTDPYAAVPAPTVSACNFTNRNYGHGTWTLNPGVYCGNLTFSSDAIVTMNPGVYIVAGSDSSHRTLTFGDNVRVTGTRVTIFLTRRSGSNYARITATNSARVTLTAPNTGTATDGIVFFGDRNAPRSTPNTFGGNAEVNITGAFYFPSQTTTFTNSAHGTSDCSQLIAATIQIQATTWSFSASDCAATGIKPITRGGGGSSTTQLVE